MIALLQRVTEARVRIDDGIAGEIGPGLLVLAGFERDDTPARLPRFLERILNYRVFSDDRGRMNLSLADTGGGLLLVPQFTLAADTDSGNRPGFSTAAPPELGEALFDELVQRAGRAHGSVATGVFGAHMLVELVNDGPVTFRLRLPSGHRL